MAMARIKCAFSHDTSGLVEPYVPRIGADAGLMQCNRQEMEKEDRFAGVLLPSDAVRSFYLSCVHALFELEYIWFHPNGTDPPTLARADQKRNQEMLPFPSLSLSLFPNKQSKLLLWGERKRERDRLRSHLLLIRISSANHPRTHLFASLYLTVPCEAFFHAYSNTK